MAHFLDIIAHPSGEPLGISIGRKAQELSGIFKNGDEICLFQHRALQTLGHSQAFGGYQGSEITRTQVTCACNAEFQGMTPRVTRNMSLEYFKPLLEAIVSNPDGPTVPVVACAVLEGMKNWTDREAKLNAEWGTFCENVKNDEASPFEKAISWLGYGILEEPKWNCTLQGRDVRDALVTSGARFLEMLSEPPSHPISGEVAGISLDEAHRAPSHIKGQILNYGFQAIIEDPHGEEEARKAARAGYDAADIKAKFEIMFTLAREKEARLELQQTAQGLKGEEGSSIMIDNDEKMLVVDGMRLKIK
jgi:hypothetical protein